MDDKQQKCLQACEDARYYFEPLASRAPARLKEPGPGSTAVLVEQLEAQLSTRKDIYDNQSRFIKVITRLRDRLEMSLLDGDLS